MAVAFSNGVFRASGNITVGNPLNVTSVTVNTNELLLVFATIKQSAGSGSYSGATWNSLSLAQFGAFTDAANDRVEVWWLYNTGAPATVTLAITVGVGGSNINTAFAQTFTGVNQSSPLATVYHGAPTGSVNIVSGSVTAPSGDLLVDFYYWDNNAAQSTAQTPNAGQTSPTNGIYAPFTGVTDLTSYKAGTGSSTTLGWTLTANEEGTYVVLDVQQALGGGGDNLYYVRRRLYFI